MRLNGNVALVTGATSDIGRAIVLRFAQEGSDIVIAYHRSARAKDIAEEVRALGRKAMTVKVDISQFSNVEQMVCQTIAEFGKIDILVNNAAATWLRTRLPEMTEEEWDRVINVNLKGYFNCTLLVSKQMIKQKAGRIINISSIAANTTVPGQVAYVTSKGGINSLTMAAAVDLAPYHINVNAIAPGSIDTTRIAQENLKKRRVRIPLGELGEPEDIAAVALFLASEDAKHVTGRIIVVDGGETIYRTYD
jgi:3-oxoacyl-[acyl-carrier protein] reductase